MRTKERKREIKRLTLLQVQKRESFKFTLHLKKKKNAYLKLY